MSNSINQQIESTSYQIRQQEKAQRRGDEQILTAKLNSKNVAHGKDIVVPSNPDDKETKAAQKKGGKAPSKPTLPTPKRGGLQFSYNGNEVSLIAIIGKVLAMQAKTNSNFWKNLWTQASKSMKIQVSFAPIIGKAVKDAADEQASATRAQAKMEEISGGIELAGFATSVGLGAFMAYSSPAEEGVDAAPKTIEPESGDGDPDAANGTNSASTTTNGVDEQEGATSAETEGRTEEAADDADDQTKNAKAKETLEKADGEKEGANKKWAKFKNAMSRAKKGANHWLVSTAQMGQTINAGTMGSTSIVKSQYQSKIAQHQGQQGVYESLSKEAEQYAQYYGQSFNRSEEIRQGAQQNINYAMDILKSVVQTITQTVNSMFQG